MLGHPFEYEHPEVWRLIDRAANLAAKRSPHLGDWATLSQDMRDYDRDFVRSLPIVLAKVGLRIVRRR